MQDDPTVFMQTVARRWLALPALVLMLVVAACGDAATGNGPANQVSVQDNYFIPAQITVPINSTVTFVWGGSIPHNVTYFAGPAPLPPSSTTVASGIFTSTFAQAGTYDYSCTLHGGMVGKVIVTP